MIVWQQSGREGCMDWTRRAVLGGALAGFGVAALPARAQVTGGRIVTLESFASRHVAARKVLVWLPAAYDARRSARFPVLYMHDGQNLFDGKSAFAGEWGVDEAITRMAARGDLRDTIVVGIVNTAARYSEYFPQKVAAHLPEAYRAAVMEMAGGALRGDAYLHFIVEELKPAIDRQFRTLAGAADTSVMGSSMGGLISLYAIGEYPRVFGQAACLSIHLPLAAPMAPYSRPPEGPEAVARALRAWLAGSAFDPTRNLYFASVVDMGNLMFIPPGQENPARKKGGGRDAADAGLGAGAHVRAAQLYRHRA
ncbi:MAG: hypothetical protein B7Y97_07355 [Sphingomonas sp. 32-66-10]|nr:MAG: hypothetical protein B7Y97_07355 [Sphingomonas sp. 32-66-10]